MKIDDKQFLDMIYSRFNICASDITSVLPLEIEDYQIIPSYIVRGMDYQHLIFRTFADILTGPLPYRKSYIEHPGEDPYFIDFKIREQHNLTEGDENIRTCTTKLSIPSFINNHPVFKDNLLSRLQQLNIQHVSGDVYRVPYYYMSSDILEIVGGDLLDVSISGISADGSAMERVNKAIRVEKLTSINRLPIYTTMGIEKANSNEKNLSNCSSIKINNGEWFYHGDVIRSLIVKNKTCGALHYCLHTNQLTLNCVIQNKDIEVISYVINIMGCCSLKKIQSGATISYMDGNKAVIIIMEIGEGTKKENNLTSDKIYAMICYI